MTAEKGKRAAYTLEYKLEAVRLVQGGQPGAVTAKILGIPKQTLENRTSTQAGDVYLKLTVIDDVLIVSFKEL